MNNETYTKTQFNEIKQQLSSYAISSFGKKLIEGTQPHSKLSVVKKRLTQKQPKPKTYLIAICMYHLWGCKASNISPIN